MVFVREKLSGPQTKIIEFSKPLVRPMVDSGGLAGGPMIVTATKCLLPVLCTLVVPLTRISMYQITYQLKLSIKQLRGVGHMACFSANVDNRLCH
jgi:hypothetical protein